MSKALGDTEKTVLVGGLILGGWLGLDAWIKHVEKRDRAQSAEDGEPTSPARRRDRVLRQRQRRRRLA